MLRLLVLSALLGLVVAQADGDATQRDIRAMGGTWKVHELTEKGQKVAAKELEPIELFFAATKLAIHDEGKFREEITLKVDAAKSPKSIDFSYTKGPNTGRLDKGIYMLDGDTLTICTTEATDGVRPKEFLSTKDNGYSLVVLKRQKK